MADQDMNNHLFNESEEAAIDLDIKAEVHFSRKDHPEGKMVPVSIGEKEEYVLIPLNIKDGDTVKAEGKGKYSPSSGKAGDLYVLVHIEEGKKIPWKLILIATLIAVAIVSATTALRKMSSSHQPVIDTTIVQKDTEQDVMMTVSTEDPAEIAYQNAVSHCAELKAGGSYSEAVRYLKECMNHYGDDRRYGDLLEEYENLLKESILETASDHVAAEQYRLAIQTLDEAWKMYGYQVFRDCAATYRKDFGVKNTAYFSAGKYNTILIRDDHDVDIVGDNSYGESDANGWSNIIAVGAGDRHVVGLKADGSVVAAGEHTYRQCDVSDWHDVIAISAGDVHTVALTESGTVLATGYNAQKQCQVEKLTYASGERRIVSVAAGYQHTLVLLEDGTVVSCGDDSVYRGCCDVYSWSDIVSIYAGTSFSAGLKSDGTVVVTGVNRSNTSVNNAWNVSDWKDIVNLSAGDYFLIGLKADGTILSAGLADEIGNDAANEISAWRNIVQISAGHDHVVALTEDGKVLCAGNNDYGQCDFYGAILNYTTN